MTKTAFTLLADIPIHLKYFLKEETERNISASSSFVFERNKHELFRIRRRKCGIRRTGIRCIRSGCFSRFCGFRFFGFTATERETTETNDNESQSNQFFHVFVFCKRRTLEHKHHNDAMLLWDGKNRLPTFDDTGNANKRQYGV